MYTEKNKLVIPMLSYQSVIIEYFEGLNIKLINIERIEKMKE